MLSMEPTCDRVLILTKETLKNSRISGRLLKQEWSAIPDNYKQIVKELAKTPQICKDCIHPATLYVFEWTKNKTMPDETLMTTCEMCWKKMQHQRLVTDTAVTANPIAAIRLIRPIRPIRPTLSQTSAESGIYTEM